MNQIPLNTLDLIPNAIHCIYSHFCTDYNGSSQSTVDEAYWIPGMKTGLSECKSDKSTQHRNKTQSCKLTLLWTEVPQVSMHLAALLTLKFCCLPRPDSANPINLGLDIPSLKGLSFLGRS